MEFIQKKPETSINAKSHFNVVIEFEHGTDGLCSTEDIQFSYTKRGKALLKKFLIDFHAFLSDNSEHNEREDHKSFIQNWVCEEYSPVFMGGVKGCGWLESGDINLYIPGDIVSNYNYDARFSGYRIYLNINNSKDNIEDSMEDDIKVGKQDGVYELDVIFDENDKAEIDRVIKEDQEIYEKYDGEGYFNLVYEEQDDDEDERNHPYFIKRKELIENFIKQLPID